MKFHHSYLERLFDHCLRRKCHRQILLTSNYRTHQIILTFLSKVSLWVCLTWYLLPKRSFLAFFTSTCFARNNECNLRPWLRWLYSSKTAERNPHNHSQVTTFGEATASTCQIICTLQSYMRTYSDGKNYYSKRFLNTAPNILTMVI